MTEQVKGGQWVICYRPFVEAGFRVWGSAYTVEDIERKKWKCKAEHPFSEVWASPAHRAYLGKPESDQGEV